MEIWKAITDYEGRYEVSNLGRFRNIRSGKNRIVVQSTRRVKGYESCSIQLWKNGKRNTLSSHRVVALHFIPNPDNKPFINHKDGDSQNNRVDNLEWCTQKENIYHSRHISRNGAVISSLKIKRLYQINSNMPCEEFVNLLLENCT